jgi:MFS family permease
MGRWYILGLICLMYLITYLDRVNISTAAPAISDEFHFDKVTMGVIFSAFGWSYAAFQVPGGWLSDRFGPRKVLTAIVSYWSAMTVLTAAATGWISFFLIRLFFGAGEAGAFPSATRAMQLWYPRSERGLVQGVTHSASRLGAAIAPPFVALIIVGGQLDLSWLGFSISVPALGWRSVFYICGAIGLVWSLWWYVSYRNRRSTASSAAPNSRTSAASTRKAKSGPPQSKKKPRTCPGRRCCARPTCGRSCAPISPTSIASTFSSPGCRPIWWSFGISRC